MLDSCVQQIQKFNSRRPLSHATVPIPRLQVKIAPLDRVRIVPPVCRCEFLESGFAYMDARRIPLSNRECLSGPPRNLAHITLAPAWGFAKAFDRSLLIIIHGWTMCFPSNFPWLNFFAMAFDRSLRRIAHRTAVSNFYASCLPKERALFSIHPDNGDGLGMFLENTRLSAMPNGALGNMYTGFISQMMSSHAGLVCPALFDQSCWTSQSNIVWPVLLDRPVQHCLISPAGPIRLTLFDQSCWNNLSNIIQRLWYQMFIRYQIQCIQ